MFEGIRGKKILITGASGGIGSCMVALFADYGACLGLHYRTNREKTLDIVKEIGRKTGKTELFQADFLNSRSLKNLIKEFIKKFGGIDILINNAGAAFAYKHFSDLSEESWHHTFDLNVKAPFYLSGEAFHYMKEQGGGRIINISSVNVKYGGSAWSLHYCAAKAALESLTVGFAREGAKHNILVNAIRCGVIDTPMRTNIKGYDEEKFKKRIELTPLKRAGKSIDIARMALYLASEGGDYITGEILTVAGGD